METWYFAKCDKCKEVKKFFVNDPIRTVGYFDYFDPVEKHYPKATEVKQWFIKHYGCELTLGWRDDHLDQLWDEGYTNADLQ
jgi:hypothetical protein